MFSGTRHTVLLLGALAFALPVRADVLADVQQRLAAHDRVCADFTQTKYLSALTRPLVSDGRMVFAADKGVLWRVTDPFPAQFLIRPDSLVRWDEAGNPQRMPNGALPVFSVLSDVFISAFAGKLDGLDRSFETEAALEGDRWRVTLVPKDKALRAAIAALTLRGGAYVEGLDITERRGDSTEIVFRNIQGATCILTDAERDDLAQ